MAAYEKDEGEFQTSKEPAYGDSGLHTSHKFEEMFTIDEILSLEDLTKKWEYNTFCNKPNSWEVIIKFEKQIPFDNFNLFVTMRRTDINMDKENEGIVLIRFLNMEGKKCPEKYELKCMFKGRMAKHEVFAVDPHFNCLLREEDHMTLPGDMLIVNMELFVRGCCSHAIKDRPELREPTLEEQVQSIINRFKPRNYPGMQ